MPFLEKFCNISHNHWHNHTEEIICLINLSVIMVVKKKEKENPTKLQEATFNIYLVSFILRS